MKIPDIYPMPWKLHIEAPFLERLYKLHQTGIVEQEENYKVNGLLIVLLLNKTKIKKSLGEPIWTHHKSYI